PSGRRPPPRWRGPRRSRLSLPSVWRPRRPRTGPPPTPSGISSRRWAWRSRTARKGPPGPGYNMKNALRFITGGHFLSPQVGQNIGGVGIRLHLGHHLFDDAVGADNEGGADHPHGHLAVVLLLLPYAVGLNSGQLRVGEENKGQL